MKNQSNPAYDQAMANARGVSLPAIGAALVAAPVAAQTQALVAIRAALGDQYDPAAGEAMSVLRVMNAWKAEAELGEKYKQMALGAAQAGKVAPADLHDAIMRLSCDATRSMFSSKSEMMAYKEGHRDARHAAADLAAGVEAGQVAVPEGFVLMPRRLTAENGAKGLLSGEFAESCSVTCPSCDGAGEVDVDCECGECKGEGTVEERVAVGWDTIKRIYDMAVEHLAAPSAPAVAQQAPAQAERAPTDLSHRLRETADQQPGWKPLLTAAADEIERYYGGMMAWKRTAEKKDRDWSEARMARENERCAARAALPRWIDDLKGSDPTIDSLIEHIIAQASTPDVRQEQQK
jgi:hypothetical protein